MNVLRPGYTILCYVDGGNLLDSFACNPFFANEEEKIPFVHDSAIEEHYGSGMFLVCPGLHIHDYTLAKENELERDSLLSEEGKFTCNIEGIHGRGYDEVEEFLQLKFEEQDLILSVNENMQSSRFYRKDTNEKLIVLSLPFFFTDIRQYAKEDMVDQLKEASEKGFFIEGMTSQSNFDSLLKTLESKGKTVCLTSKSYTGIPFPFFIEKESGDVMFGHELFAHYTELVKEHGPNAWEILPIEQLLPSNFSHLKDKVEKGKEVIDTCILAGFSIPHAISHMPVETSPDDISAIIEGREQNESWLLYSSVALSLKEESFPEKTFFKIHKLIADRFSEADDVEKISKASESTNIEDMIEGAVKLNEKRQYGSGVDVLRWWSALVDNPHEINDFINLNSQDIRNPFFSNLR